LTRGDRDDSQKQGEGRFLSCVFLCCIRACLFGLSLLESGIAGGEREVLGIYDWDNRLRALGYRVGILGIGIIGCRSQGFSFF
jgi:hypothetical protein